MSRSRLFSVTSVISTIGILCLLLFQLVLSDLPCEEHEMCVNYNDRHPNGWYIWILLLVFMATLLCGAVVLCLQCWLRRPRIDSHRRTMAVFAVGDLDSIYGTEAAVSPTVGIHLQTQTPDLYPVPYEEILGSPPPYEDIIKTS
ncbi:transmembrane protein 207 [Saimiri boliviensis]|uniref:Transmembrane protein 207 n=1 Tax=Saimiri boliviensis boliviensis TaxID=39432 RepID=A0A2K6V7W4_SAIBB|nr:transmembrane protein 207 [Saimiri boliviensis boliviensis]XP_010336025.1 transmembrane protein 207 [Saimiri boliviensis boliviensis]